MSSLYVMSRHWLQGLWLLITVSVTWGGEVCTYTKKEGNTHTYRRSYCSGHCCDNTASRCCEDDEDVDWWVVGGVLCAVVFLIVFIVILTLCLFKRANRNKSRVRDTQGNNEMQMTIRLPRGERQPNVYLIDPPPYASHGMFVVQPPVYPGSIRRNGGEYNEGGGSRSGGRNETAGSRGVGHNEEGGSRSGGHNATTGPRRGVHSEEGGSSGGGLHEEGRLRGGGYYDEGRLRGSGHHQDGVPRGSGHFDDTALRVDMTQPGASASTFTRAHDDNSGPFSSTGTPDGILYDDTTPAPDYYPEKPWAEFPPPAYSFK